MGATQPAGIPKLHKLDTAMGTFPLVEETGLVTLFNLAGSAFGAHALLRVKELVVTLLAQVQFFVVVLTHHFRDVVSGWLGTLVALQHCSNSRFGHAQIPCPCAILTVRGMLSRTGNQGSRIRDPV